MILSAKFLSKAQYVGALLALLKLNCHNASFLSQVLHNCFTLLHIIIALYLLHNHDEIFRTIIENIGAIIE